MKRYVIYSAIIGAYDNIIQPSIVDDDFDYILFSDCITEKKIGVWEVRQIDFTYPITAKIARYVKTHSHTLLNGYECSLWIDASIAITSDYIYRRVRGLYDNHTLISSLHHPERDCIYDEALAVMMYRFEKEDVIVNWLCHLRENHFPEHVGLHETGILYRLHCDKIAMLNEDWWTLINIYSHRDQLSFDFILWRNQVECMDFFPPEHRIRNSEHVCLKPHADDRRKDVYQNTILPPLIQICKRFPQYEIIIRNIYEKSFHSNHPRRVINAYIIRYYPHYLILKTYKCIKRGIKKHIIRKTSQNEA